MEPKGSSPEDRNARSSQLADEYRERLASGTVETREEFLSSHEDLRDLLEPLLERTMVLDDSAVGGGTSSEMPERIGPYRILSRLGEGGMGIVYVAEQKEPVRRRVALKVIKKGMDSEQILRRFDAERQALAMMEHDNISRVFDAGSTETGQPYFSMEYVKGQPINEYCDSLRLGLEERLDLFRQVCSGVQHAHQKGVIHRDLTPRNVLVSVQDGQPTPKIIDFGIARATDHRLTQATIFTQQGQVIGTPEYMSPEQAGLNALDIDTRSDVYSLGVLLYELMVGQLPFSTEELRSGGLAQMERKIREDEPPRPSTCLGGGTRRGGTKGGGTKSSGTKGGSTKDVADLRRTDEGSLVRRLKGDLDWITMKALEKDRTRRYQTAIELAQDIERHTKHEPVLASPPSMTYRLAKFVRRHRVQVVAAVLVLVAIVAGTISTAVFAVRAERNAVRAESQLERAEELTSFLVFDVHNILKGIGRLDLLADLANRVNEHYESLPLEELSDDGRAKVARALNNLGTVLFDQGDIELALSTYTRAARSLEALVERDPGNVEWPTELARGQLYISVVHRTLGDLESALSFDRQALQTLGVLREGNPENRDVERLLARAHQETGSALRARGQLPQALSNHETARDLRRGLVDLDPDRGRWQADLAESHHSIGGIRQTRGNLQGARDAYGLALAIRRALAQRDPTNTVWKHDLASSHSSMGRALFDQGHHDEARASYERALEVRRGLAEYDPGNAAWQAELAGTYLRLGVFSSRQGELNVALTSHRSALDIRRRLSNQDPSNASWRSDLADSHHGVGVALRRQGRLADALDSYRAALRIREELVARDPTNARRKSDLAKAHNNIGNVLQGQGNLPAALESYGSALEIEEELVALDPSNAAWKSEVAGSHNNIGVAFTVRGTPDAALESHTSALEIRKQLVALDSTNARWKVGLAGSYETVGRLLERRRDLRGAMVNWRSALEIREDLVAGHPTDASWKSELAASHDMVGNLFNRQGDPKGVLDSWRDALEVRKDLVAQNPSNASFMRELADSYDNVGNALKGRGDLDDALESYNAASDIRRDLVVGDPSNQMWMTLLAVTNGRIAYVLYETESYEDSAAAFLEALKDRGFRDDLPAFNLYNAACVAALAAGAKQDAVAQNWRRQALAWLAEDQESRHARVAQIEAEIRAADPNSGDFQRLTAEKQAHTRHFEWARSRDPELASLRGTPGFDALFPPKVP
jgi:serine/threonine-protein kinase